MNDEKEDLRITARLTSQEAAQLRELANRTSEGVSTLVRKALQHYHTAQFLETTITEPVPIQDDDVQQGETTPLDEAPPPVVTNDDITSPVVSPDSSSISPSTHIPQKPKAIDYGMGVRVLTAPFNPANGLFDDEAVQRFLLNKRVRRLVPAFFSQEGRAYWTAWVEYEPVSGAPIPIRPSGNKEHALDATQQSIYDRLSAWRKVKAEASGLPVFIIATNKELVDVARLQPQTLEALRQIKGFGKNKIERYGQDIISLVRSFLDTSNKR